MIISINDNVCSRHGITKEAALVLGAIQYGSDEVYKDLIDKGLITSVNGSLLELNKKYTITPKGINLFSDVILESDKDPSINCDMTDLVKELRSIYPEGRMPGTSYYYRGNTADIEKKLKSFFKRYGNNYTKEQILDATRRYVQSFNGSYTYMRLLKYFIWKDEVRDGETIQVSQLAEWIDNANQVNSTSMDWTSTLN